MWFARISRSLAIVLAVLSPLCCGGCLLPRVSPLGAVTPEIDLGTDSREIAARIHAFHVDGTGTTCRSEGRGFLTPWGTCGGYVNEEKYISRRLGGIEIRCTPALEGSWLVSLPAQRLPGWSRGWALLMPYSTEERSWSDETSIALYQPGFELIWIHDDDKPAAVRWQPAADLRAQVCALDQLFFPNPQSVNGGNCRMSREDHVAPGSSAPAHRAALLFGASEYDRLAGLAERQMPPDEDQPRSLRRKAGELRALAER